MKRRCGVITFCVLVAGCDAASTSITGPNPPGPADTATYTLTGRIVDHAGVAVPGALVHLDGTVNQTTVSDERGEYQIAGIRGFFVLRVSKDDYESYRTNIFIGADQALTIALPPKGQNTLTLTAGVTLRGTIQGPPCDPAWDATAPCVMVHFTPPATGSYELVLRWTGPSAVDLMIDGDFRLYWESYTGEIRVTVPGHAGVRRDLLMHAYHLPPVPETFELTATLLPGS